MNITSIGLVGISGVGKSTFIRKVQTHCLIEHLPASEIIQSELFETTGRKLTPAQLRERNIGENQAALISGFQKIKLRASVPSVLDAHTVVDKEGVLIPIKHSVFATFGFDLLICLVAPASQIIEQRANDKTRNRPKLTLENIEYHQESSRRQAIEIGTSLGIPTFVLTAGDERKMAKLIYPNLD